MAELERRMWAARHLLRGLGHVLGVTKDGKTTCQNCGEKFALYRPNGSDLTQAVKCGFISDNSRTTSAKTIDNPVQSGRIEDCLDSTVT